MEQSAFRCHHKILVVLRSPLQLLVLFKRTAITADPMIGEPGGKSDVISVFQTLVQDFHDGLRISFSSVTPEFLRISICVFRDRVCNNRSNQQKENHQHARDNPGIVVGFSHHCGFRLGIPPSETRHFPVVPRGLVICFPTVWAYALFQSDFTAAVFAFHSINPFSFRNLSHSAIGMNSSFFSL